MGCVCVFVQIWTSQLKRTVQTAKHLSGQVEQWKALNELEVVSSVTYTCARTVYSVYTMYMYMYMYSVHVHACTCTSDVSV